MGKFHADSWEAALYSTIERLYQGCDLKGELETLEDAGFVEVEKILMNTALRK